MVFFGKKVKSKKPFWEDDDVDFSGGVGGHSDPTPDQEKLWGSAMGALPVQHRQTTELSALTSASG